MTDIEQALRTHAAAETYAPPDLHAMLGDVVYRRGVQWWAVAASVVTVLALVGGLTALALNRGGAHTSAPGGGSSALTGTVWNVVTFLAPDGTRTDERRHAATVQIDAGALLGNDGCNTLSGPVTVENDRVIIGNLATTLVGCPEGTPPLSQVLQGAVTWSVEADELTLRSAAGTLLCTRGGPATTFPAPQDTGSPSSGGGVVVSGSVGSALPGRS